MTLPYLRSLSPAALALAWWFNISWSGSGTATALGPYRSMSQCVTLTRDASIKPAFKTKCDFVGEPGPDGWWFFITGAQTLTLTSGLYPDQQTCDQFRTTLPQDGDTVSATCWPSR